MENLCLESLANPVIKLNAQQTTPKVNFLNRLASALSLMKQFFVYKLEEYSLLSKSSAIQYHSNYSQKNPTYINFEKSQS